MALRDYYRCKQCDAKIAYGPDRPDEDWEPFLFCRDCLATLRSENERLKVALRGLLDRHNDNTEEEYWAEWDTAIDALQATQKGSE